jgi:hypothetical protein
LRGVHSRRVVQSLQSVFAESPEGKNLRPRDGCHSRRSALRLVGAPLQGRGEGERRHCPKQEHERARRETTRHPRASICPPRNSGARLTASSSTLVTNPEGKNASAIRTPQLVHDGVRSTRDYISAPQCVPSRAGVVTGRYQQKFGVEDIPRAVLKVTFATGWGPTARRPSLLHWRSALPLR